MTSLSFKRRSSAECEIVVLKFGSSVLRTEDDLPTAVHEIYRHVRGGRRVVAVVSAIGDTTDELIERGRSWCDPADPFVAAKLLATGEEVSAALLGLALGRVGLPSAVFDPRSAGLATTGFALDAEPVSLDAAAFEHAFERSDVIVVPGFVGVDSDAGHTTLLGRGGSDLSAVFIAREIGAKRCILVKDVDGVYTSDPNVRGSHATRFATLSWDDAIEVAGELVQAKAIEFAKEQRLEIEIAAFASSAGTVIGRGPSVGEDGVSCERPLRVGLLGLGTVGGGVYRRLSEHPERFEVTRVAVRDVAKERTEAVPADRLTTDVREVIESDCDVVVDLRSGDVGPDGDGSSWIEYALASGRSVVTACKETAAESLGALQELAKRYGATVRASASVGGGTPILETVARLVEQSDALGSPITAFEGVLNGTTNYVLERIGQGASLADAVAEAQRLGFAEADPSRDLSGHDTWQKTRILRRAVFGHDLPRESAFVSGVDRVDDSLVDESRRRGLVLKLVAYARETASGVVARVGVRPVAPDSALARPRGEQNVILLHHADGSSRELFGRGAGRWPTTEAVFADLLDELDARRHALRRGHVEDASATTHRSATAGLEVA